MQQAGAHSKGGVGLHAKSVFTLAGVPWSMFVMVSFVSALLEGWQPELIYITISLCLIVSCLCIMVFMQTKGRRLPIYLYIGVLGILAVLCGAVTGIEISERKMAQYWSPILRPTYDNVSPVSNPMSMQDGGVLHFDTKARVDLQRVAGWEDLRGGDNTYCVAPIVTDDEPREAKYWAVGLNCCGHRWSYTCDSAGIPGARSGLVVLSTGSSYSVARWNAYHKTAAQAASAYGMHIPKQPIFVRWVMNVDQSRTEYRDEAVSLLIVWCSLYLLWSLIIGMMLHWTTRKEDQALARKQALMFTRA